MNKYFDIFINGYKNYFSYLINDILNPSWNSYFYWLLIVSIFFLVLEVLLPWRKNQKAIRKDFWLDAFYMYFNFFLFSLIIYSATSDLVVNLFNDGIKTISGIDLKTCNPMYNLPIWGVLLIGFIIRDFIQWWIHRLLHKVDFLWEFHKVHHSVEEMGFAAHLRYHWMENVVYRTLEYIPLALLGIGLYDFFIIHIFALAWGHYNHANFSINKKIVGAVVGAFFAFIFWNGFAELNYFAQSLFLTKLGVSISCILLGAFVLSPFIKKIFNSPEMHIWHHSYELPNKRRLGVNFGLTLACWDYIFGTAYIPKEGRDIRLGFPGVEEFPNEFVTQNLHGFNN